MLNPDARRPPRVLRALMAAAAEHPFERKLVVCRRRGVGRELLRSLAAAGSPWANFEVTTPRQIAHEAVAADLTAGGERVADEFEELALLDAAIDRVLAGERGTLAELAEGPGLRQAVGNSVRALRLAGIGATALERARFRDEDKRAQIARILDTYEQSLRAAKLVDAAALLARAAAAFAVGNATLPAAHVYLLPGQSLRGLNGQLLQVLQERGAEVLSADPVWGLPRPAAWLEAPPSAVHAAGATPLSGLHDVAGSTAETAAGEVELEVFAATSLTAELREVLRRVMTAGLRWDEVEIIATDATAYGVALDGLTRRLGVAVTYAVGLPAARTRPGRAVAKYLEWVQRGLPADLLRQMLERGDIAPPTFEGAPPVSGVALARRLRALGVARGGERYIEVLEQRQRALDLPPLEDEEGSPADAAERQARERTELTALSALLRPLLAGTPAVADALAPATVSPAALAQGSLALLELVPATTAVDGTAKSRLVERLQRISRLVARPTTLKAAAAMLMSRLEERVPAPEADGAAPWISAGGHLHLSDLEHGGHACRGATFVVGLDAARFPGGGGSDALLVDDDRRRLTGGQAVPALPTAAERLEEARYAFAALVARLRGRVTFSYAMWDAVEGRAVAPASELLQAYRLLTGDATADYEALHASVAPAASAVPRGHAPLDSDDVWLHALSGAGALRRGVAAVCAAYPHLAAGVSAFRARRRRDEAGAHHGIIAPRAAHDPRGDDLQVLSPKQLETLGTCPHRYLLRYVLRVIPPVDPDDEPEQWLSPLEKGNLMHRLYERSLRHVLEGRTGVAAAAFETLVFALLEEEIAQQRARVPPPGDAVFELEREQLREDARAFVAMVREDGRPLVALEQRFGPPAGEPLRLELPDGSSIRLRGAIDRVDELEDGRLIVVDYKTGSMLRYGGSSRVFDGGRRLQHVLYAAAAERIFGRPVARAEYHFPTRRSVNHRARYTSAELSDGLAVIIDLLELVEHGWFVPTNAADDCRHCDYAAVCRAHVGPFGRVTSPLADWSRETTSGVVHNLRRVRR
jgi:hypothetical protein